MCTPIIRNMVRLRLQELLDERGITAYVLASKIDMTETRAYRLVNAQGKGKFGRISADTINQLCTFFGVTPGELFEYVPDKKKR
jgi:DNA-binding Xre family transcriptional regulator